MNSNSDNKNSANIPHSKLGIIAFAIAEILFVFIVTYAIFHFSGGLDSLSEEIRRIGMIMFRLFYFLLPLSCVMAIFSMTHQDRRKVFGALALGTNGTSTIILIAILTVS